MLKGRYKILTVLSQERSTTTYLAQDTYLRTRCVLERITAAPRSQLQPQTALTLVQEVDSALTLIGHPALPKSLDSFMEGRCAFWVRAYIEGNSLKEIATPVHQQTVIRWLRELLAALAQLHQQGLYHDNIAPENIVIDYQTQKPVLIGGNYVELLHSCQQGTREQAQLTAQLSATDDLYRLAVLAIALLLGQDFNALMTTRNWIAHWQDHARVSDQLAAVLDRMLSLYSHHHSQSAEQFLTAITDLFLTEELAEDFSAEADRGLGEGGLALVILVVLLVLLPSLLVGIGLSSMYQTLFERPSAVQTEQYP